MDAATAAALERARAAIEALGETPPAFVQGMRLALEQAEAALKEEPRGKWAWKKPDKRTYLNKLPDDDPVLPLRAEAYAALEHLQQVGFAALDAVERQRHKRQRKADAAAAEAAAAADQPMPDASAAGAFACGLLIVLSTPCSLSTA